MVLLEDWSGVSLCTGRSSLDGRFACEDEYSCDDVRGHASNASIDGQKKRYTSLQCTHTRTTWNADTNFVHRGDGHCGYVSLPRVSKRLESL